MIYIITWTVVLLASASAVAALIWALQRGQLQGLERGARTIFDGDEQAGAETDQFPAQKTPDP